MRSKGDRFAYIPSSIDNEYLFAEFPLNFLPYFSSFSFFLFSFFFNALILTKLLIFVYFYLVRFVSSEKSVTHVVTSIDGDVVQYVARESLERNSDSKMVTKSRTVFVAVPPLIFPA